MLEKFNMPMVVRQKGLIDDTLKVYIESRVIQYIKELKDKTKSGCRYGVLVGKMEQIEEEECLVISGVVKCNCKRIEDLDDYFIKQVRGYIYEQVSRYFNGCKIVGLVSIDKESNNRNEQVVKNFKKIFKEEHNILFMQGKFSEELCYVIKEKIEGLKGYFVYYEKNENMKTYALENEVEIICDNVTNESDDRITYMQSLKKISKIPTLINMSLFLLCVVLGLGLIQNLELTRKLEKKMKVMTALPDFTVVSNAEELETNEEKSNISINEQKTNETSNEQEVKISGTVNTPTVVETFSNETNGGEEIEKLERIEEPKYTEEYQYYTIQKGDSLKGISKKFFGTDEHVENIKKINDIDNENYIQSGKVIKLPILS